MAKLTDITIDVKANLNVDRRTAETCLRLVEIFCNTNRIGVIGHLDKDGYTTFEFDRKSSNAINAIGREPQKGE